MSKGPSDSLSDSLLWTSDEYWRFSMFFNETNIVFYFLKDSLDEKMSDVCEDLDKGPFDT